MTVHFNFAFWGSSPSMACSLHKWECKAIDIKSILIQECVGFFSSVSNRNLSGCFDLAAWGRWASKCRTLGLEGRLWTTVLSCAQLHIEIKCQFCVPDFHHNWSLQLFPTLRDTGLSFTQKFLEQLLGFSKCLNSVNLAQFNLLSF